MAATVQRWIVQGLEAARRNPRHAAFLVVLAIMPCGFGIAALYVAVRRLQRERNFTLPRVVPLYAGADPEKDTVELKFDMREALRSRSNA